MTIRQRWKQTALHNKLLVIIAGLGLIAAVVPRIVEAIRNPGTQSGNPLLYVRPPVKDAHLRWDNGEFSPRAEQGDDSFAITAKNSGNHDAINLTFTFVLKLDMDELIKAAQTSGLFSSKHIEGDAKRLKIPTRYGLSETSWALINFTEDNVVKRDEIQTQSEIVVTYPPIIKNAIYLWLLTTSHSQGTTWRAREHESIPPDDPNLLMKYFEDENREQQRARIMVLPDVTITILYHDVQQNTFSTTYTIRSIYEYEWDSWAKWARDDRQQRLFLGNLVNAWLVFHGIPHAPGDYSIGHPEGSEDQILTWNEAKLGPRPTKEELFFMPAFIRDQQQVLSGGQGALCYEDQNNSSEGRYNRYNNQDLLAPWSSSSATHRSP